MSYQKQIILTEADIMRADPAKATEYGLTSADIPALEALWHKTLEDLGKSLRIEQLLEFLESMIAELTKTVKSEDVDRIGELLTPVAELH